MTTRILRSLLGAGLLLGIAGLQPALADAIDGSWCSPDGKRLSIAGAQIVTPGGHRITGNYSRHAFSYTVPANEPGTGATINMTLMDEYTVYLRAGSNTKVEVWRRCRRPTS